MVVPSDHRRRADTSPRVASATSQATGTARLQPVRSSTPLVLTLILHDAH